MLTKKKVSLFIWISAALWSVLGVLSWSHLPIEYKNDSLALTFNSMMEHMLHGTFDVSPNIIDKEGFLRNGKVYAYWGIFPALLRLPLFILPHNLALHLNVTRLSESVALLIILFFNYKLWLFLSQKYLGQNSSSSIILALALAFSGEQVCFLQHRLYQEVCFWALAFAAWFVYSSVRVLSDEKYWQRGGVYMAVAASLSLLTRVSIGIGLYLALFCFLVFFFCKWCYSFKTKELSYTISSIMIPSIISLCGILITGYVNYKRWGNPLTFANYDLYLYNTEFPSRLARTKTYGLFNIGRFYLGVVYFFVPIWIIQKYNGHYILQENFNKLIDAIELPPSSFFLTDGFMLLCGLFLIYGFFSKKRPYLPINKIMFGSVAISLAVPAFLMMIAISMNYRYRGEFYPDIVMLGSLGYVYIHTHFKDMVCLKRILLVLLVTSILFSNLNILLYGESDLGPAYMYINKGIISYYKYKIF